MENTYKLPLTGTQITEKLTQVEVTTEGLTLANNKVTTRGDLTVTGNITVQGKKLATEDHAHTSFDTLNVGTLTIGGVTVEPLGNTKF